MFFRHGIEKVPFSRDSLENISFEPSRHPSALDELPYRESFLAGFSTGSFGWSVSFQKDTFSQIWIKYRIFGYGKQAPTVNSKSNPISGYIRLFQHWHSADILSCWPPAQSWQYLNLWTTVCADAYILSEKMKNQFCFWHTLHFWRFIYLVQKCIDQFKGFFPDTACKKTGTADTAESRRKQMHQESPDEFFCGNGHLFHSVRGSMIIFVTECDSFFIIRQDPAVWYRSTVWVLSCTYPFPWQGSIVTLRLYFIGAKPHIWKMCSNREYGASDPNQDCPAAQSHRSEFGAAWVNLALWKTLQYKVNLVYSSFFCNHLCC